MHYYFYGKICEYAYQVGFLKLLKDISSDQVLPTNWILKIMFISRTFCDPDTTDVSYKPVLVLLVTSSLRVFSHDLTKISFLSYVKENMHSNCLE